MGAKSKSKGDAAKKGGQEKTEGGKLKGGQAIKVRHILCQKHSKREEALAQIKLLAENDPACKDNEPRLQHFIEIAKQYSEDKANQGGLISKEFKTKGSLYPEFESVAYTLKPQNDPKGTIEIGEAKTEEGYHLIVVEERK